MNKNIEIGVGIGEIKFGMTRDQVLAILGKPTEKEIEQDAETGSSFETWDYEEIGLAFTFDEILDWKLETISVFSPEIQLNGTGLIGKNIEFIQDFIDDNDLGEMEHEDFSTPEFPEHELIDVEESNLCFTFVSDVCLDIQFGVHWDEDDNVVWPE